MWTSGIVVCTVPIHWMRWAWCPVLWRTHRSRIAWHAVAIELQGEESAMRSTFGSSKRKSPDRLKHGRCCVCGLTAPGLNDKCPAQLPKCPPMPACLPVAKLSSSTTTFWLFLICSTTYLLWTQNLEFLPTTASLERGCRCAFRVVTLCASTTRVRLY